MSALLPLALAAAIAADPTHDIAPDDAFSLDGVAGIATDTRGSRVAYIRTRWGEDRPERDLWLLDTRSRDTARLTFTDGEVKAPRFLPDGSALLVLAPDADGHDQLHRVAAGGGPLIPLTHGDDPVAQYVVDPGGRAAWIVVHGPEHTDDAWTALRDTHAGVTYVDRDRRVSRVERLDLDTFRRDPVWSPGAYIVDLDVSRDGTLAAITAPSERLVDHEGRTDVVVYDPATATRATLPDTLWRADAPSPYGWLHDIAWASDGRALAFQVDFDGHPGEILVAEWAAGETALWRLPRPREVHPDGPGIQWVPGRRELCFGAASRARRPLVCVDGVRGVSAGRARTVPAGDVVVGDFAFSADGRDLVALVGTPERFPELYRLPARGNLAVVPLTDLNPHTASWRLPALSTVAWTAPDGTPVEGVLELPHGWTPDQGPLPTVVLIHGGPTAAAPLARSFRYHGRTALAAAGYAVLLPNYRGSVGYGDAFLTDLIGRETEIEVADILAGVDHLVAEGVADPGRLAISGWSNGGFLVHALIGQTDRFRAAIAGAGVADQVMQWALEDTPGHVINFMQGLPWEQPAAYAAASPVQHLGAATTPTLFHVGEHDARVPAAHARAMFRALDTYRKVPAELIIYPDTGHGLATRPHQRTKLAWDLAWLARWLAVEPAEPTDPPEPASADAE